MKKKELFWVLVLIPLASILLLTLCQGSFASTEEELRKVEQQLESERLKLRSAKEKESKALNKLYVITKELNQTRKDLESTRTRIYQNRGKIAALEEEIRDTEQEIGKASTLLSRRAKEAYKSGGAATFLDLLFSSRSIADFVNRTYYLEKIIAADMTLIGSIREEADKVAVAKRSLESSIKEMKGLAQDIERKKEDIEDQADEKKKAWESLRERREEYERRVKELEKSSRELEGLIRRAEGDRTKPQVGGTGKMIWPARGRLVSSYGYRRNPVWGGTQFHTGIDIGAAYGEPVKAADGGGVIFSGWWDGYGKAVVIDHGKSIATVYGHMSRLYVEAGQRLEKGQIIGLVGSTGFSTGPHLHFEVRKSGTPVNPSAFVY